MYESTDYADLKFQLRSRDESRDSTSISEITVVVLCVPLVGICRKVFHIKRDSFHVHHLWHQYLWQMKKRKPMYSNACRENDYCWLSPFQLLITFYTSKMSRLLKRARKARVIHAVESVEAEGERSGADRCTWRPPAAASAVRSFVTITLLVNGVRPRVFAQCLRFATFCQHTQRFPLIIQWLLANRSVNDQWCQTWHKSSKRAYTAAAMSSFVSIKDADSYFHFIAR